MLDLNFVRENLPLVEEKLRQRGMDPAAVLKDFREVDTTRSPRPRPGKPSATKLLRKSPN
jgi:seryl-tRNA synthetase